MVESLILYIDDLSMQRLTLINKILQGLYTNRFVDLSKIGMLDVEAPLYLVPVLDRVIFIY